MLRPSCFREVDNIVPSVYLADGFKHEQCFNNTNIDIFPCFLTAVFQNVAGYTTKRYVSRPGHAENIAYLPLVAVQSDEHRQKEFLGQTILFGSCCLTVNSRPLCKQALVQRRDFFGGDSEVRDGSSDFLENMDCFRECCYIQRKVFRVAEYVAVTVDEDVVTRTAGLQRSAVGPPAGQRLCIGKVTVPALVECLYTLVQFVNGEPAFWNVPAMCFVRLPQFHIPSVLTDHGDARLPCFVVVVQRAVVNGQHPSRVCPFGHFGDCDWPFHDGYPITAFGCRLGLDLDDDRLAILTGNEDTVGGVGRVVAADGQCRVGLDTVMVLADSKDLLGQRTVGQLRLHRLRVGVVGSTGVQRHNADESGGKNKNFLHAEHATNGVDCCQDQ